MLINSAMEHKPSKLDMEAVCSSETFTGIYKITRSRNPKDHNKRKQTYIK